MRDKQPKFLTKEELRHAAMRELKVSKESFDFGWIEAIEQSGRHDWYEPPISHQKLTAGSCPVAFSRGVLCFGQKQFVVCGIDDAYQHGAATVAFQTVSLEPTGIDAWRFSSKELEPPIAFGTLDQLKTRQRNGRVWERRAHSRYSSR